MIENRAVGIKSREVYEAPAAMALIAAHSALEDVVLTKAELQLKRRSSSAGPSWSTRGSGSARPRGDRRLRRPDAAPRQRARCASSCDRTRDRHRPALGAHALRGAARLVRHGRDVPARGRGGLHPDRRARDRVGSGSRARQDARVTRSGSRDCLGRVERQRSIRPCGSSCAPTTRSSSLRLRGDRVHAGRLARGRHPDRDELREIEERLALLAQAAQPSCASRTRTCTRRSSGCSGTSGGRSTPAARATTRSPRRFGCTCSGRVREARDEIDALALVVVDLAEAEAETSMPGYTHLQRGAADHARPPPARVGRDARP